MQTATTAKMFVIENYNGHEIRTKESAPGHTSLIYSNGNFIGATVSDLTKNGFTSIQKAKEKIDAFATKTKYRLGNIKTSESRNGFSLSCTLFINDVLTADFIDTGDGSQPTFRIKEKKMFAELERQLKKMPPVFIEDCFGTIKIDTCLFIDLLHAAQVNRKPFNLLSL